ncbi:DUF2813 domain-containing protein [Vibrio sp. S11_S32]|uniref:DUF2813 domain-containing protein n=1 Tax=Vibrio sp. S11_S32 TaxID=2720225 RepID=UPI001680272F|nr:DUF2813 domain-containing protein [Vibrio sp. S11_S32]MBD1577149.1 DUF2813 domain-containing protein [Vibrio sp. S11_S32]
MQLERIEIVGFRGIQRLSIGFDEITTLLGENTWGKSSLLDALCIALPHNGQLYPFQIQDFHVNYALSQPQTQHIQIVTQWRTQHKSEHLSARYRRLKPIWIDSDHADNDKNSDSEDTKSFLFQISAIRNEHKVSTHYQFLDWEGNVLAIHDCEQLALELSRLHPVIRLRDARRLHQQNEEVIFSDDNDKEKIERRVNNTYRRLSAMPGHVNKAELKSTINAMQHLIEHYFSFQNQPKQNPREARDGLFSGLSESINPNKDSLIHLLKSNKNHQSKLLLMGLLNAYFQAKGAADISQSARPIMILEDPESRLHPTNLLKSWELLQMIPMQKIVTTNSGILLSAVPFFSIRRLVRQSDKTVALSIPHHLLSHDELRRISFHIRFHRPNALFARSWLLVEGETEFWLFNELAKVCGYQLANEGIQLVEFAQSGLKSLIKVAKALKIDWHVVTDGDAAGNKYATTVRSLLEQDLEQHRLTELPDKDIENFLYHHGFEKFFRDLINIPIDQPVSAKKVINRVLKKHAKPDVALSIAEYCEQQGIEQIPQLLRRILKRVITMANGNN